ncbi:MAG TPA: hypothetical protein VHY59_06710 [Chthoniobacterales bacterium]|nr:hypothetical protein [Chthoniobacterales bacterium]
MAESVTHDIFWVITLFFLGAIGVLIIMNPNGFASVGGTLFGGLNTLGTTLTGSGYRKAKK